MHKIRHFEVARKTDMVVKVHCETVLGDEFAAMLKMRFENLFR